MLRVYYFSIIHLKKYLKMTAVPAERRKTKDPFQLELDKEIAKRRSRGLKTGSPDEDSNDGNKSELSDEYEDDFDVGSDHGSDEGEFSNIIWWTYLHIRCIIFGVSCVVSG